LPKRTLLGRWGWCGKAAPLKALVPQTPARYITVPLRITTTAIVELSVLLGRLVGAGEQPNSMATVVLNLGYGDFKIHSRLKLSAQAKNR